MALCPQLGGKGDLEFKDSAEEFSMASWTQCMQASTDIRVTMFMLKQLAISIRIITAGWSKFTMARSIIRQLS